MGNGIRMQDAMGTVIIIIIITTITITAIETRIEDLSEIGIITEVVAVVEGEMVIGVEVEMAKLATLVAAVEEAQVQIEDRTSVEEAVAAAVEAEVEQGVIIVLWMICPLVLEEGKHTTLRFQRWVTGVVEQAVEG